MVDAEVCRAWGITPGNLLSARATRTWAAERNGEPYIVQRFPFAIDYQLKVAAALRERGWPTPQPAREPLTGENGVWALFHRLPGEPAHTLDHRARGRLLAELHSDALATGITDQREGWTGPAQRVADPELESWLRRYEKCSPQAGTLLLRCRDAALEWFTAHPSPEAPSGVIHGDFTPWNLLYSGGQLTGVLDFEGTHHTFQVADFALSWRGHQDDVLRGYDEVRPLTDAEWNLILPVYWSWLLLGLTALPVEKADLRWQVDHLHRHSPLLAGKTGRGGLFNHGRR
ncbi:phosphotransferase [Kineosporia sp. J2-2]|uniref:Phosphotransferase n=1 Tax=Kineosporia corallincola TaxID=2835133 RepID=A0ABS5TQ71_9ACTN|nr:phosphotransferase [Kineosporia corallincola]MBT0773155.1 phosphotransferase [Kineosporia corallincola]